MKLSVLVFAAMFVFSQNSFARETILKKSELSLTQDLYNAKTRKALAQAQIKIAENELKRQTELHAQLQAIRKAMPGAVSEQEFKESETAVAVAGFNISEVKELFESAKADEAVYQTYLQETDNERITATQISQRYYAVWVARNKAAGFAVNKSEAELNLAVYLRDLSAELVAKNAESVKNLIIAERNVTRAQESLQRAKDAAAVTEEAMKKFE